MNLALVSEPRASWLPADLNARLEHYAWYYEHVHGESADTKALIPEILRAFLQATVSSSRGRAPLTASHTASQFRLHPTTAPRPNRDLHQRGTG
jgi:hypothetical protein